MKNAKLFETLVVKDKAYYMHGLFDLMATANLRQIKAICALASMMVNERMGAENREDVPESEI